MKIIQIYKSDLLNGTGLRNVYFFSGCEGLCERCFSPETHEVNSEISRLWESNDFDQLLEDASKSYISGITLTGGDPFHPVNREDILDLCKRFKEHFGQEKTIWLYTGYTWEVIEKAKDSRWECLKYIDVLCEGPYVERLKSPTKPWVGSSNQRVIDVKKTLKEGKIIEVK